MKTIVSEGAFCKKLFELAESEGNKDYLKFQRDFPNVYINLASSEGMEKYEKTLPDLPEDFELEPI